MNAIRTALSLAAATAMSSVGLIALGQIMTLAA